MTSTKISKRIVGDRLAWVDKMVNEINTLPMETFEAFTSDSRNVWTAESCLRRSLEALLDIGRHILAKRFSKGVSEYKEIAIELGRIKVLGEEEAQLLRRLAGYRNRLVHFYHEITTDELYRICNDDLGDLLAIRDAYLGWFKSNPDSIDQVL